MYKKTNKKVKGDGKRVNGNMKANLLSFLLVFVVLAVMLTVAACKSESSGSGVTTESEKITTEDHNTGTTQNGTTDSTETSTDETTVPPETTPEVTEHVCEEGADYVTDGTFHFRECVYCGSVLGEKVEHTYENGSCTVCNYAHEDHTGGIATCKDKAVCTVCALPYGETAPHTYSNGVCVSCNAEHTDHAGGKATCTEQALCEVCGVHYGEKDPTVHSSTEFSYETVADKKYTTHTKKYACCGAVATQEESHTFNSAGTCEGCGFLCDHEGFWEGSKCSNCLSGCKEHTGGEATCTTLAKCEKCGEAYGTYKAHVENSAWESDGSSHYKTCKNCNKEISGTRKNHSGGTATCTAKAKCKDCGKEYGELLNHVPSSTYRVSENEHWQVCKNCSAEISGSRKSHNGGNATCNAKAKCKDCGKEYGNLLAHVENTAYAADANSHYKTCKNCNKEISGTRKDHNGGNATCKELAKCSDCGKAYGTLASHVEGSAYSTDGTYHWKVCAKCSAVIGSKANHAYSNGKCTVCQYTHTSHTGGVATCKDKKKCTVCGASYGELEGHTYANGKCTSCGTQHTDHKGGKATCTEQAVCDVCGAHYGNKNPSNHSGTTIVYTPSTGTDKYTKHTKTYECCGASAGANEAHTFSTDGSGNCTVCSFSCDHEGYYTDGECSNCKSSCQHSGGKATCTEQAKCEKCGKAYGSKADHEYSDEYTSNGTYHYKTCKACGAMNRDTKAKCYGGEATCQSKAKCDVCHNEYGNKGDHSYGQLESDANYHWRSCKYCGIKKDNAAHSGGTATCTSKAKCSTCGTEHGELKAHTEENSWTVDGGEHYKKCSVCHNEISSTRKAHSGGTATCTTKAKCTDCGAEHGNLAQHSESKNYTTDGNQHWKTCTVCSSVVGTKTNHTYENGKCKTCQYAHTNHTGGTATCKVQAKCSTCGVAYGELGAHTESKNYTTDGSQHWKTCTVCSSVVGTKTNHTGGTATCTTKAKCSTCGVAYGNVANHVASTSYTTDGNQHWKKCANCNEIVVAKANHTYTNGKCTTCQYAHTNHTGAEYECVSGTCDVCGATYTATKSHSYGTTYKYDDANHWYECACGAVKDGSVGPHTYGDDKKCTKCSSLMAYDKALYTSIFKSPTSEFRWHSINHGLVNALGTSSISSHASNWANQGLGGFVTNISFSNGYLSDSNAFNNLLKVMKNIYGYSLNYNSDIAGEKFNIWLYDELGYPSGGAGGKTVYDNPDYQAKGLICITKTLTGGSGSVGKPSEAIKIVTAYAVSGGKVTTEGITVNESKVSYSGVSGTLYVFALKNFHEGTHAANNGWAKGSDTVKWSSPYYINIMDKSAVKAFINNTYNKYRLGLKDGTYSYFADVIGIFTDEPSLMEKYQNTSKDQTFTYAQLSWVDGFDVKFEEMHGYSILDNLHHMFSSDYESAEAKIVRVNYRQTVGELVSTNYFGQLAEYCRKYGTKLTGHGLLEENIYDHVLYYGDLMQSLRQMDIPGVDSLHANPQNYMDYNVFMAVKYATSVATIAGKGRHTMVEFCAPEVNTSNMTAQSKMWIWKTLNLMYFQGITHVNSYFEIGYLGNDARTYTDYFARLGYISRQAKWDGDVALYYPINTEQAYSTPSNSENTKKSSNAGTINQVAKEMFKNQLDFTVVDNEFILEAEVKDGRLYTENVSFSVVCMPAVEVMPYDVLQKLSEFQNAGGKIVWITTKPSLPTNINDKSAFTTLVNKMGISAVSESTGVSQVKAAVKDSKLSISYTGSDLYVGKYNLDGKKMYWLYNYSDTNRTLTFSYTGSNGIDVYDPRTGNITSYSSSSTNITIKAADALIIIVK